MSNSPALYPGNLGLRRYPWIWLECFDGGMHCFASSPSSKYGDFCIYIAFDSISCSSALPRPIKQQSIKIWWRLNLKLAELNTFINHIALQTKLSAFQLRLYKLVSNLDTARVRCTIIIHIYHNFSLRCLQNHIHQEDKLNKTLIKSSLT